MQQGLNPDWYFLVRSEMISNFEKRDNVIILKNNFKMLSYLEWVYESWRDRAIADDEVFDYISNIDLMIKGEFDFIWKNRFPVTVFPYISKSRKSRK